MARVRLIARGSPPPRRGAPRLGLVEVAGTSMEPSLRPGDVLLVRWRARARPGRVVLARFAAAPGALVVKRVARVDADGVWLVGDNPAASDDSRTRGPVAPRDVLAGVVLRVRRGAQRSRRPST